MRERAGTRHTRSDDHGTPRVGQEQVVERRGMDGVAHHRARVREQRDPGHPDRVLRQLGEARRCDVDLAPCLVLAPDLGVEVGERDPPSGDVRLLLDRGRDGRLELVEPALIAACRKDLHAVGVERVGAGPLAEHQRLVRELLAFVEAALEERAHCAVHRAVPEVQRLAQLVGKPRLRFHVAIRRPHVALLEQVDDPEVATACELLLVARGFGESHDLRRDREPLVEMTRSPEDGVPAVEGVGENGRVADPSRHGDGVLAERVAALARRRRVENHREPRGDARAECAVLGTERGQRFLEEPELVGIVQPEHEPVAAIGERGARERLGRPEPPGRVRRLADRPGRLLELARAAPRRAETEEQVGARGVVVRAVCGEQVDGSLIVTRSLLVGELCQRTLAGASGVADGLVDVAAVLRGLREVIGHLGYVAFRSRAMEVLQHLADLPVQADALRRAHLVVERLADERVREAMPSDGLGDLGDDARADRFVEPFEELLGRRPGERREHVEAELATDRRRDAQHLVAGGGEPLQPSPDHLAHALRHGELGAGDLSLGAEAPFGHQETHDLADEERIALGLAVHRRDELGRRCRPRRHLDVARHVVLGEAAQGETASHGLAGQVAERLEQRMLAAELHVAIGADHEEPRRTHLARQELQQQERRLIGPLDVVQDEDQRLRAGGVPQKGGDAVEEPEARLLGLERGRGREVGQPLTHLGYDLGDVRGARPHLGLHALCVAVVEVGTDDLDPRPVRRCTAGLVRASPQDLEAAHTRIRAELARGARLADPGLTGQEDEPPLAAAGVVDRTAELFDLGLAPDEDTAGEAVERVRLLGRCGNRRSGRDRCERASHRGGGGRPVLGRLREELQHERLERSRHFAVVP